MTESGKWTKRSGKWAAGAALLTVSGAAGTGCLSRPVGTQPPTTKVNFTSSQSQQSIDKIDLLFMIDNSASMGDKQAILADAVPNLLVGLLKPKCADPATGIPAAGAPSADPKGNKGNNYGCPAGTEPEFRPVTDMHIGVISSSLGSFGGNLCPESGAEPKDTKRNDRGRLLTAAEGGPNPDAQPAGFLSWYPQNLENTEKKRHPDPPTKTAFGDTEALATSFASIVKGVGQAGCGLEAQMESWYHFLVQPDPWLNVTIDNAKQASLGPVGEVDVDLLKQRADFLRPDSLVAVILLTDEDDSSVDPLSGNGFGWQFMNSLPLPRATSACASDASSKDCASCGSPDPKVKSDPECQKGNGYYSADEDQSNARFSHQLIKRNYGFDPQYPISRYTDGLTNTKVPDRSAEHTETTSADGKRTISAYKGTGKCTNPLFAAKLPRAGEDVCNLPRGSRSPEQIFFAVVGGVPNQLLHFDPTDPEKSRITEADWVKILGRDPVHYNYEGIDPHMLESKTARPGLAAPSDARGDNGSDPIHGREWDTRGGDLQYACTFPLPVGPKRDCSSSETCDCATSKNTNPPLCGKVVDAPEQIRAKAYPTVREFLAVRALDKQGIIASLCPANLDGDKQNPTYGYNPAVKAIVDRLKNALTTQCLPQQLTRDTETSQVPCLVLAQLGSEAVDTPDVCSSQGLERPEPAILAKFIEQQKLESGNVGDAGIDLAKRPVCQLPQLTVKQGQTCKENANKGWCYVENDGVAKPAGRCPQALIFSAAAGALAGATFSLQCIQQFSPGEAAGDTVVAKP